MKYLYSSWLVIGWMVFTLPACSYGPDFLETDNRLVKEETRTWIHYAPDTASPAETWLMFYPGGLVDPHVYEEWLSRLAATGLHIVVTKMPVNLAVTAINRGERIRKDFPEASSWVIAGHSLGGAMACATVDADREAYKGIILLASYPGNQNDLSNWSRPVLSLSGELDGLSRPEDLASRAPLLPPAFRSGGIFDWPDILPGTTVYHEIPGANHAQFGSYGPQEGDWEASIPREQQHQELITWISVFFTLNDWR